MRLVPRDQLWGELDGSELVFVAGTVKVKVAPGAIASLKRKETAEPLSPMPVFKVKLADGSGFEGFPAGGGFPFKCAVGLVFVSSAQVDLFERSNAPGRLAVASGRTADIKDLVFHIACDGDARDLTGNEHDGILTDVTAAPDRFGREGKAFSFNGGTSKITVQNSRDLHFSNQAFSLLGWVRFDQPMGDVGFLVKHVPGHGNGYGLGVSNDWFSSCIVSDPCLTAPETSRDGRWHLVVGVYGNDQHQLYVDGSRKAVQPRLNGNLNNVDITIGQTSNGYAFRGELDEVRLVSRALTEEEIREIYKKEKPGN